MAAGAEALQEATRIEEQAEKEKVFQHSPNTLHTNIIASLLTFTAFQALSMPDNRCGEMSIDDLRAKWQHEEGIEDEVSIEDLRAAWRLLKRLGLLLDENLTRSEARRPPLCALPRLARPTRPSSPARPRSPTVCVLLVGRLRRCCRWPRKSWAENLESGSPSCAAPARRSITRSGLWRISDDKQQPRR